MVQSQFAHLLKAKTPFQNTQERLSDGSEYRSIVGAMQYLSLTRPDIAFAVNKVLFVYAPPTSDHWVAVKRILRYLKHTIQCGHLLQPFTTAALHTFTDADWAERIDNRRSTSGYGVYIGLNLISWSSIPRSCTEAKYKG